MNTVNAPSDTGAVTTGPTSFSDLPSTAWHETSSVSTPSTESTAAASASADATVPPASTSAPEGSPQQTGEPPKDRWDDILKNARTKASEDALTQWRQQYGWAEQIDRVSLQEAVRIAQLAKADPIAYLQDFIKELQTHPTHGAQLKSLAAKALAARTQGPTEPQPDLPIQLEDGRVVHLYSADQQAKREAWLRDQWLAQVQQQQAPLQQTVEQWQKAQQAAQEQYAIDRFVTTTFDDLKTWPGMDDAANQKAVGQWLAEHPASSDDPRDVALALDRAYRTVVLPTLSQKTEAKLLDSLKTKAAASTGVNPGSSAPSTPRKYDRFDQLPAEMWR